MVTRIENKKLSKSSSAWMQEHIDDPYVKKAQIDGYRARAAYKLLEINEKTNLIKKGMTVVDLGSAPGSWSQVAGQLVGEKGVLIASDILPMDTLPDVTFIQGDFREAEVFDRIMAEVGDKQVDGAIASGIGCHIGQHHIDLFIAHFCHDTVKHLCLAKVALNKGNIGQGIHGQNIRCN